MKLILIILIVSIVSLVNGIHISPESYSGFKIGHVQADKFYIASNYAASQDDALLACANFVGGRLATILSREEYETVANMLPPSLNDYTTYWTAGRNVGGTWTWMTTNEAIEEAVLFWDGGGVYPIGTPGHGLAIPKYGDTIPFIYTDQWGANAIKKFVCEVSN